MTTALAVHTLYWDAIVLLNIINPDNDCFCCVGYAPSQGRRCRNPIAQHNKERARIILANLPRISANEAILRQHLYGLAELALCRRYHQGQATTVAIRWYGRITAELERLNVVPMSPASSAPSSVFAGDDDASEAESDTTAATSIHALIEEVQSLRSQMSLLLEGEQQRKVEEERRREAESLRQLREEQRHEEQRLKYEQELQRSRREEQRLQEERRREESLRQAEREKADREAEARQQAEQELARRDAEEVERRRRREEEEAAKAVEQEQRSEAGWLDGLLCCFVL